MCDELLRICCNCNSFFTHSEEISSGCGVCLNDEAFTEYIDEVLEESNFSCCYNLYQEKRISENSPACADYQEIELNEETDIDPVSYINAMKTIDLTELDDMLNDTENTEPDQVIRSLCYYLLLKNRQAFDILVRYYQSMPSVIQIKEVHRKIEIIDSLVSSIFKDETIDVLINDLYTLPSNNTTSQLFRKILSSLAKFTLEKVDDKLLKLLQDREFRPKMKANILGVIFPEIVNYDCPW